MLHSRILQPDEYDSFLLFNRRNNGADVKLTYVEKAKIRIFYYIDQPDYTKQTHYVNQPDYWVAAYAVNTEAEFRYLSVLTREEANKVLYEHGISRADLVEITLLSRNPQIPWRAPKHRESYYGMSLLDALLTGKQYIIGGSVEEKLADAQLEVLNQILYEGDMNFFGHSDYGWLYYAPRYRAVLNALYRLLRRPLRLPKLNNLRSTRPQPTTPSNVPNN